MRETDQRLLHKTVDVGAWRLETDKEKLYVPVGSTLCAEIVRLTELMNTAGVRTDTCWDLFASNNDTGRGTAFTLKSSSRGSDDVSQHKIIDLSLSQGVRIQRETYVMDAILSCPNRDETTLVLSGGRKIRNWDDQRIPGLMAPPVIPADIPTFDSVGDFLPFVEELCPVSESGIAQQLAASFIDKP